MRLVLLGSVQAYTDDASPIAIGGARLRMLLARLALEAGRVVSVDGLVDGVWGEDPPADAANALQALVSRLRKALRGVGTVESTAGGYRLSVRTEDVDAHRFEQLAGQGRRHLAAGRFDEAAAALGTALGLWQGAALADVLEAPFAGAAAARLEEVRAAAAEDRFDAELRLGRHAEVMADLGAAGAAHPLSERLAGLRMRALWAAGRQSDALATYEEIRDRLSEELGVDPSAELQEIHLTLLRGELERPAGRPETAASRLPAQLTSFVGRETELARLAGLLTTSRLVTIVGPGGAGKTRLSLEALTRDRAYARGRVWFVPLAAVAAADQLVDAVLGAIGATDGGLYDAGQTHKTAPVDRMAELLDVGDAVLVLDNCEHLVEATAELADRLLERLPQLRILASSREPLAITGEALCHLGPLDVPTGTPEPAAAARAEAVRLFVDRAASVRPGFAVDETTVDAVVEICWRLDGMPLALELAAAKLRSMSVDQLARRLDDRFRLLTSGSRTALPRQRTLLAVVEWSWDLLDEAERALAGRLSAFPGGATLAALEAVCADPTLPVDDVLYVLDSLIEKSLVTASEGDEPRYRMLETVRAYAANRLAESGDDISGPFAAYFLALAEENEPRLRTREQLDAITVFDAEHANLVFALRSAVDAGNGALASRFVDAMFWYWGVRGMNAQLETALAEVRKLGDALPRAHSLVSSSDSAGAREFHPAGLLLRLSQLAFSDGESESADTDSGPRRSLDSPDPWVRASAHLAYDFVLTEQGDLRTGAPSRLEALHGFETVGDRWGLVMSLIPVGRDHSLRGEHAAAIAVFERAVALSSELGTEDFLHLSKARLARERRRSGDLDGARRDLESALRRAKERGHRRLEANILVGLANLHRRTGDLEQANGVLDHLEALVRRRAIPVEAAEDLIVSTRMENRLAQGAAAQARALLPTAAAALFAQGAGAGLAWVAELLGGLLDLEGDPVGAATALGMSQVIRGAFDAGEPELRELVDRLVGRLGEEGYREAYRKGAELPRPDALNRLAEEVGQPVAS
ncbi:winged helix-turn-helix domain-containing protein [Streptomyces sp. LX-29]|uniref:BTAD domain-containing putative transcriptional regulator n=1 Tax=Streptomyces sp. LX-29 TaxID=2900152 RepID=UPI00240E7538|nr:BTAD domain-containing putative transcriptional regulator [Streptomyces sp. LX-29]WFB08284.1 winged helix-turn-helix domain-containing protein [Streptomyces sp. LX-29]